MAREKRKRGFVPTRPVRLVIACVVFGTCLAVPAVFVNTAIGYLPLIAYLIVLGLSFAYIRLLRGQIAFEGLGASSECVRGEDIDFKFTVTNSSFLPAVRVEALFFMSDIFGGKGATDVHYVTLGPRRSKTFDIGIRFDHIGTYQVGIKEVKVLDVFGIFSSVQENRKLTEVNVQPRVFDVDTLPLTKESALEAKRAFSAVINDGMDYSGVREYRWGDPIKTIHWKLSARMPDGDYHTRLYETNANPGMSVIADFDAPAYTVEELMTVYDAVVECSFSIERFAAQCGFEAEFVFQDKAKRTRHYTAPFAGRHQEVLDRMPQIFSPGTGKEALSLIREEQNSYYGQCNLVVCTSVISEELVETLVAVRVGKRVPLLLAVVPPTVDGDVRKRIQDRLRRLGAAGVYYAVIGSARDLEGEAR